MGFKLHNGINYNYFSRFISCVVIYMCKNYHSLLKLDFAANFQLVIKSTGSKFSCLDALLHF